jgi:hypothetical protein
VTKHRDHDPLTERIIGFAQLLTYLKLRGVRTGLLLNFGASTSKEGLRRFSL